MSIKIIELLNHRIASRAMKTEALEPAIIDDLAEAARLAPSCYNKQPWRFLFLTGGESLNMGREALVEPNRVWADRAPLLIVAYTNSDDDCKLKDGREYHEFDLGLSVMNIMLAATEHGLAARPMAGFNPQKIIDSFDLDEGYKPLVVLAVGKPDNDDGYLPDRLQGAQDKPRERKKVEEFVQILDK